MDNVTFPETDTAIAKLGKFYVEATECPETITVSVNGNQYEVWEENGKLVTKEFKIW